MKFNIFKSLLWAMLFTTFGMVIVPGLTLAKSNIVIGLQQEPTSLDPTSDATASIDGMLSHNVYESLTTVSEAGEVLPNFILTDAALAQEIIDSSELSNWKGPEGYADQFLALWGVA